MNKPLCIYHGNCADGFTAAWAVWKRFGDAFDYHAGVYQDPPPDVANRDVVIVDFSYKRPVLEAMLRSGDQNQAASILILDHHKSAAADLSGLVAPGRGLLDPDDAFEPRHWRNGWESAGEWPVRAVFDMARSGAGLAWDFFHPRARRPRLVDYVEDRDLWRFALLESRAVNAYVFAHDYSFAGWDALADEIENDLDAVVGGGRAIEKKRSKDVRELVAALKTRGLVGAFNVPVANIPYTYASDAGNIMAEGEPFAACWWETAAGRVYSLRSVEGGQDVSVIAAAFGGGGHARAAGFRVERGVDAKTAP